jgi:hypothetical protein
MRHYFRKRGMKKGIALHGLPGSEQFMSEYAQALAGLPDAEKTEIGAKISSFSEAGYLIRLPPHPRSCFF